MSNWGPTANANSTGVRAALTRPRLLIGGGALVALLLAGGGGYLLVQGQGHHPTRVVAKASPGPTSSSIPSPTPQPSVLPSPAASAGGGSGNLAATGYFIKPKPAVAKLSVPSLGISGPVIPVDLAKDGTMGVTNRADDMGWWDRGPLPGAPGDSVIGGHLDWYVAPHAIFWNLKSIKQGADIYVTRSDGPAFHFVVYQIRTVSYNSDLPDLFSPAGPPRLTLITCGGVFDARSQNYSVRVLVDAHLA